MIGFLRVVVWLAEAAVSLALALLFYDAVGRLTGDHKGEKIKPRRKLRRRQGGS